MQIMQKFLFMFCIEVVKNSKAGIRPRQLSVQFNVSDMQICDVTALPARSLGKKCLPQTGNKLWYKRPAGLRNDVTFSLGFPDATVEVFSPTKSLFFVRLCHPPTSRGQKTIYNHSRWFELQANQIYLFSASVCRRQALEGSRPRGGLQSR